MFCFKQFNIAVTLGQKGRDQANAHCKINFKKTSITGIYIMYAWKEWKANFKVGVSNKDRFTKGATWSMKLKTSDFWRVVIIKWTLNLLFFLQYIIDSNHSWGWPFIEYCMTSPHCSPLTDSHSRTTRAPRHTGLFSFVSDPPCHIYWVFT